MGRFVWVVCGAALLGASLFIIGCQSGGSSHQETGSCKHTRSTLSTRSLTNDLGFSTRVDDMLVEFSRQRLFDHALDVLEQRYASEVAAGSSAQKVGLQELLRWLADDRKVRAALVGLAVSGRLEDGDLAALARFPNLRWLNLTKADGLSEEGIAHLPRSASLRQVTLPAACGGRADAMLGALLPLRELDALWLPSNAHTSRGLARLGRLRNLRDLHVVGDGVTEHVARALARCTSLERVSFWGKHEITDDGLAALAALPNLERIYLGHPRKLTLSGLAHLLATNSEATVGVQGSYAEQQEALKSETYPVVIHPPDPRLPSVGYRRYEGGLPRKLLAVIKESTAEEAPSGAEVAPGTASAEAQEALLADLIDAPRELAPRTLYWVEARYRYDQAQPWQRLPNPAQDEKRPADLPAKDEKGRPLKVAVRIILNSGAYPKLARILPGLRPEHVDVLSIEPSAPFEEESAGAQRSESSSVLADLALEQATELRRLELHHFPLTPQCEALLKTLPALQECLHVTGSEENRRIVEVAKAQETDD